MRIMTIDHAGRAEPVLVGQGGSLLPLRPIGFQSVRALVEAGPAAWADVQARAEGVPALCNLQDSTWRALAPLPDPPRNIFCAGVNYRSHFDEGDRPEQTRLPESPVIFTKPFTVLVGDDATVVIDPAVTTQVDWEAEVAVVIGIGGRNIPESEALSHVFGYSLANDVSARDLQRAGGTMSQWFKGKSLDGFGPMGPDIRTPDELAGRDPETISVELRVSGVLKQRFCVRDMVHPIPKLISYLSRGMRLLPGDIIFSGTASGVGLWRKPPEYLRHGDVTVITSPQLGELRTRFVVAGEPGV
ncbi:MAG TPA: fumarylacetoacetate hydrolase family protein [Acidimicrobiales bacterium]|nr:fumarylacetoacetate hydrolase family protein [Acidimicrobiales bacterium]